MTDTDVTANYEFVDDAIVDVIESKELSRCLKDRIYQTIEEHGGITLDQADEIAQAVEARYLDTRVSPLDPVGTVSVQSIGEPGTQMTMNTLHYAGVVEINVTQGLSRLVGLVGAWETPNTPVITVYLEDEYTNNRELAHQVVWNIESTKILTLGDIPTNVADMVVQVNLNDETPLERWPTYDDEGVVASEIAETIEDVLGIKTRRKGTLIEFDPESPGCRRLPQLVEELRDITFKGIGKVFCAIIRKENNEDTDEEGSVLYTEGSTFDDALTVEGIDTSRTTSSNIHEVYEQPGIEAAREAIINRTMNALREQGLDDVSVRHLVLVVDIMTNDETVESIGHHGISGSRDSALVCTTFEVTVNHLLDTAIHDEEDNLDGVIEDVIVNRPIAIGTDNINLRVGSLDVEDTDTNAAPEPSDDWR